MIKDFKLLARIYSPNNNVLYSDLISMNKPTRFLSLFFIIVTTTACVSIDGPTDPHDPWERYNRTMSKFNTSVDRSIFKPVAKAYQKVLPKPVNKAITNIFNNATDVIVLANDILQFKAKQSLSDLGRIIYNTVFGLGGIFEVSTSMGFEKHYEDFGQTLAHWGVGKGPYLVLPFFGPATVRDSFGLATDFFVFDPSNLIDSVGTRAAVFSLYFVDVRAGLLPAGELVEEASLDSYIFLREAYLQRRLYLIYDGDPPEEDFDDEFE